MHTFNIAFQDANNLWSAVTSSFFYKNTVSGINNISQYQTWFDNDFANVISTSITPTNNLDLQTNLNVSSLSTGLHVLHTRFKTNDGLWSSATSYFFVKEMTSSITLSGISKFRYWFDANLSRKNEIQLVLLWHFGNV